MTQLAATVNATAELWTLDTLPSTQYVQVQDEIVEVRSRFPSQTFSLTGEETAPQIRVRRAQGGTAAASHNNGTALTALYGIGGGGGGGAIALDNQVDPPVDVTGMVAPGATIDGTTVTMVGIVISATDPWETSSALFWLRLLAGQNTFQLYAREAVDEDWVLASAAVGAGDTGDGFLDVQPRSVGVYTDLDAGNFTGLQADKDSGSSVSHTIANGDTTASLDASPTMARMLWSGLEGRSLALSDVGFVTTGLPTVNPNVAGALWNDAGTLKVSAG